MPKQFSWHTMLFIIVSSFTLAACGGGGGSDNGDADADSDGVIDSADNCINTPNTDQLDNDSDGIGNACDPTPDGNSNSTTGFEDAIFKLDDQVDTDLNMRGVVYRSSANLCTDKTGTTLCDSFNTGMSDEEDTVAFPNAARVHNVVEDDAMTYDASSFIVSTTVTPDSTVNVADAFYGAIAPGTAPWTSGWTVDITADTASDLGAGDYSHPLADDWGSAIVPGASGSCPATTTEDGTVDLGGTSFVVCVIQGDILADLSLSNDYVYVMLGDVKVGDGDAEDVANAAAVANSATLTIEAGTSIFAKSQDGSQLRVTRGSAINVNGTADMPVLMAAVTYVSGSGITDSAPLDFSGRGDWGGLVVNGFATTNNGDGAGANTNEIKSEAGPSSDTGLYFGGDNDADDSGTIRYLVLAETGFAFAANEEVQGLTVEGVGSGTEIAFVQIAGSEDDGVEIFGGTVNIDNIVIHDVADDSVDLDDGYRGQIQYVLVLQGATNGDAGIEADNKGATNDAEPKTTPVIANGLFIGHRGNGSGSVGASFKDGHGGDLENVVFIDQSASN